jgi:hypothetical protein
MIEMIVAVKKAMPWPTECPFINDVIALLMGWVVG